MEELDGDTSQLIFENFKRCNYDAVMELQQKLKVSIFKSEFDEESEILTRQK